MGYFFKRLLLFLPTLLLLSIFYFYLSRKAPGDPMLNTLESQQNQKNTAEEALLLNNLRKKYQLHLPLFYFSIYRKSASDSLNRIADKNIRHNLLSWAYQSGSWEKAVGFYNEIQRLMLQEALGIDRRNLLQELLKTPEVEKLNQKLKPLAKEGRFTALINAQKSLNQPPEWWNNYLLNFKWHGTDNQYHLWLSSLLKGDFGRSLIDGKSTTTKINAALQWTLILSLSALIIALLIAIPLAVYTSQAPNSALSRWLNIILLSLYSIPNFWMATLLIVFFSGGDYLNWFPAYGSGIIEEDLSFWSKMQIRISHLFLPVFCLTYPSLAYLYKQMKNAMEQELSKTYIQTAFSKGVSRRQILRKHAFKNASLPLITILGKAFPAIVSGSFIVEYIFSIQGMGKLSIESFLTRDYPVIFGVLMLISLLTLFGSWLADIFYQKADPRITIGGKP